MKKHKETGNKLISLFLAFAMIAATVSGGLTPSSLRVQAWESDWWYDYHSDFGYDDGDTFVLSATERLSYPVYFAVECGGGLWHTSSNVTVTGNGVYQAMITLPVDETITRIDEMYIMSDVMREPWPNVVVELREVHIDTISQGTWAINTRAHNTPQPGWLETHVHAGRDGLSIPETWNLTATFVVSNAFCFGCKLFTECICCGECGLPEHDCTCCELCAKLKDNCICCETCGLFNCVCCKKCAKTPCVCCTFCPGGFALCIRCCNACGLLSGNCDCVFCSGNHRTCKISNCTTCPPPGDPTGGYRGLQLVALDAVAGEMRRSSVIILDDHNRTHRLSLDLSGAPLEVFQLALMSEGGGFDYVPELGILPFADIRRTPTTWDNARIAISEVIINGQSVVTPRGNANTTGSLVEPANGWYATAGYVYFPLWNAWHAAHNRLAEVISVPSITAEGEEIIGFKLPGNVPITSVEVVFAVSRMPFGNPPQCSGNPLTCRATDCTLCKIVFNPNPVDATLSVVIDGNAGKIFYYNNTEIIGTLAYSFNVRGGENTFLWDIVPANWPAGSVPAIFRVAATGDSTIAGGVPGFIAANTLIATQDFSGCPHKITFSGTPVSSIGIIGQCYCSSIQLCEKCKLAECVCCAACDNNPNAPCCNSCGRVCGKCDRCQVVTALTFSVVINEVDNVILYYNNNTIHSDFDFRFFVRGDVYEFSRPNGTNGPRWPVNSVMSAPINSDTGEVVIAGVMGSPWLAGRLFLTQLYAEGSEIDIQTGNVITKLERITCEQCVMVNCMCCDNCGLFECTCKECEECSRPVLMCRCCLGCGNYICDCLGLRAVIDWSKGTISYYNNVEMRDRPFAFRFSAFGAVGTITVESNARFTAAAESEGSEFMLSGTVTGRLREGTLMAVQSFSGCAKRIRIPILINSDVIRTEVQCECGACPADDTSVNKLFVMIDAVRKMIMYHNEVPITGAFEFEFEVSGTVGTLTNHDWPRGSVPMFEQDADGRTVIAGGMTQLWDAGAVLAVQHYTGSVEDIEIFGDAAIRRVRIIGCEICERARCKCFAFVRGDINGDGRVTIEDGLEMLRYIIGLSDKITSAPFNGDCTVAYNAARSVYSRGNGPTIEDALQILVHIIGLPSVFDTCPPTCARRACQRPNGPPICQQGACIQCEYSENDCICQGVLRVEIDARENVIRYFHDVAIRPGDDLDVLFRIVGDGITLYDPEHEIQTSGERRATRLFTGTFINFMSGPTDVLFAGIMRRGLPAGALIAVQEFEGEPENIRFEPHASHVSDYPIGYVSIVY
ncbi:MAG: hypothetical protein FWD35_02470 [Oscillospiraceae bacterium]|nr:hypothetical protein [Oscillospiraceae bacterium]